MKKQLSPTELAYFAGLFDGEGCVRIHGSRTTGYGIETSVTITYAPVLEKARDNFGGSIAVVRMRVDHWKQQYSWAIGSKNAYEFLKSILPYLDEKRPQAALAIEYYERFGNLTNHRSRYEKAEQEKYYKRLQELKKVEYPPGSSPVVRNSKSKDEVSQLRLMGE